MAKIFEVKKCRWCGEWFEINSGFYKGESICKKCSNLKSSLNLQIRKEDEDYRISFNEKANAHHKKIRKCAKALCKNVKTKQEIMTLVCPVCGIEFGYVKSEYDSLLRRGKYEPKYCSRKCFGISRSKWWREKSQYAINIKRIMKEQR